MIHHCDVVVIGGGGAGMMCAIQAGRRGRRVAILEHATTIGKKILISGGGRCNFTNLDAVPAAYVSRNPDFCKSALARFTPEDFIGMVKAHRIAFHEKKLGQMFCDGSAQQIVDMLVSECEKAGVEFHLGCRVLDVGKEHRFMIETTHGSFAADSLVIATGGLSFPKIGATDFGYQLASRFGLAIIDPAPALVGLIFGDLERRNMSALAGISLDARVGCNGVSFREHLLFTHHGLSGPGVLQASLYWNPGDPVDIDLAPDSDLSEYLKAQRRQGAKAEVKKLLSEYLPQRVADQWSRRLALSRPTAELSDAQFERLAHAVHRWAVMPAGTEGYRKAEVTRGGVDTAELSSKTMEARKVPGLYFIGEVVDVTGQLGGYNFQWAWASGWAAGQAA